jgi:CO/xanthine dehydrogenase FAD-binding subunit
VRAKNKSMRGHVPSYQLVTPNSLSETLDLFAQASGQWKAFAGGTDLMVLLEAGKLAHQNYVNIWQLDALRGIEVSNDYVRLGALTTYTEVQEHPVLRDEFPMLCQAARETGGIAIQNRGTLGGNIVNASPAADSPPALLAYDAELELISRGAERRVRYADFHQGYKQMDIRPDELLKSIWLPRSSQRLVHYYRKVGTRKAQAISKVCFAGVAAMNGARCTHVRIAVGSVAPIPLRCRRTEAALGDQRIDDGVVANAVRTLASEVSPIDDVRSTKNYRLQISVNLLNDFVARLKP